MATDSILKETKSIIASLIISSAKSLNVRQLRRDYREETGQDVPFKQLGFYTLEQFLLSIPETCRINGSGDYAMVIPVINEKVKHLNDMIMKQKSNKSRGAPVMKRARGIYDTNSQNGAIPKATYPAPRNQPNPPFYHNNTSPLLHYQNPPHIPNPMAYNYNNIPPFPQYYQNRAPYNPNVYTKYNNYKQNGYASKNWCDSSKTHSYNNFKDKSPPAPVNTRYGDQTTSKDTRYSDTTELSAISDSKGNFSDIRCAEPCRAPQDDYHNSLINDKYYSELDEVYLSEEDEFMEALQLEVLKINEEPPEEVCDDVKVEYCGNINKNIIKKIQTLIWDYPDGIWCSKLLKLYSERWKQDLDILELGYPSVVQLCCELSDIVHCVRLSRMDWKIYDKRHPLPDITKLKWSDNVPTTLANPTNEEPPLPANISFDTGAAYPEHIILPGEFIELQWLTDEHTNCEFIHVIVSEVYDPSKFWVQLNGVAPDLSQLMDDMQIFYGKNHKKYNVPTEKVEINLYCVTLFMSEYHRAKVVKIFDDNTIQVFYIDYGTIGECGINQVYYLHKDFIALEQQAIRARLANIRPSKPNTMWPRKAAFRMLELVSNRSLVARVLSSDYDKAELSIILTDTSQSVDVHINDVLINEGYAVLEDEVNTLCEDDSHANKNTVETVDSKADELAAHKNYKRRISNIYAKLEQYKKSLR